MEAATEGGSKTIRVLVFEGTHIHTQLLSDALRRDGQLEVVAAPATSRDFVQVVVEQRVDVAIVASNLDEEPFRGFELVRQLRVASPDTMAVMLLDSGKKGAVLQAFHSGVRGILSQH